MPTGAHAAPCPVRPRPPPTTSSIVVLLVLVFSSYVLGADDVVDQSQLLRKFKTALTNSDPALADWNSPKPPCSGNSAQWTGVLCFNSYVWGLQLENMNLGGQIDVDSLVPLRFLRTLSFMHNNFEGAMPDWRKLGALKSLYLSDNKFSGQIPDDAFKGMTSLKKVYMANNGLTGPIPSSLESPKLIELRLDNNRFTGKIPTISYDHLKVLNVSNNQLEGPIPEPLRKMDPSSFSGNKELCGKPLASTCDPPIPPPDLDPSFDSPPTSAQAADSPPAPAAAGGGRKLSRAKIAMIVVSSLVGLLLIALIIVIFLRSRREPTPRLGREVSPSNASVAADSASASASASAAASARSASERGRKGEQLQPSSQAGKLSFVQDDDRQKFDLQDLMRASAEVLGSGTFGASYKAVLVDGDALVVKRFKLMNNVAKEDFHEHMRRLGRLKHPNLLPLVAYLYRKEEKLLVFDYVGNGSLAKHLHGKHSEEHPGLSWATRLKIIKGVARGMAYLHNELPSLTVPHGHLKSSNVLLGDDFNPLLMDYSLAPVVNPSQVHQVLVAYKSPEYTQHYRVSRKSDVWCLGILILELLTGKFAIAQGCGHHAADLAGWIDAIVKEVSGSSTQAFDKDMKISSESCRPEMEKLLKIGMACCQEDQEERLDLEEAVKQIEQVRESS